jgi:hypothetical protein
VVVEMEEESHDVLAAAVVAATGDVQEDVAVVVGLKEEALD